MLISFNLLLFFTVNSYSNGDLNGFMQAYTWALERHTPAACHLNTRFLLKS